MNIFFVVCFVLQVVMKGLLAWVKSNLIKERPEMFLKGDSVYDFRFCPMVYFCSMFMI